MGNSIITEIVGSQILERMTSQLASWSAFSTDCGDGTNEDGGTVVVAGVNAPATGGQTFGGSYATNSVSDVDKVSVTLNHYYTSFYLTDKEFNSSSANRLANLVGTKANAFGGFLTKELSKIVTTANYGAGAVKTNASYDIATIKALKSALDTKGAPLEDRALVLDSAVLGNVLPSTIETLGNEVLQEGTVRRIYGADVYATNSLDDTAKCNAFLAHKSAIAIASRRPRVQDSSSLIDVANFEIPNLGLDVQYKSFMDNLTNKHYGIIECLAGVAVGNDAGLVWNKTSA